MAAVLKSCSARLLCERTFFKCVYGGQPLPAGGGEKWGQLYPCPTAPAVPSHPHADEKEVVADTVIVATGAVARRLPFPGSDEDTGFWNKGISACAVCDGAAPMFRNQPIAVIGGGDSGALLPLLMPRPAYHCAIMAPLGSAAIVAGAMMTSWPLPASSHFLDAAADCRHRGFSWLGMHLAGACSPAGQCFVMLTSHLLLLLCSLRGGAVSHEVRQQSVHHPSAGRAAGLKDHAGASPARCCRSHVAAIWTG